MKQDNIAYMGPLVENIRNNIIDIEEKLRKQNPLWKKDIDARLTVFNKCSTVLATVSINFVLHERYLIKKDWWIGSSSIPVSEDNAKTFIQEFDMFNRIGLIHFMFASIESSFRLFLHAIDPNACGGGRAEFKGVYDCLFSRLKLRKYIDLLDIWRNVRNSLHNNGLFFPANNKNQKVGFSGVEYTFEVGKPLDFINTTVMVDLLPTIVEMLKEVVTSIEVYNLKEIIDLSA